MIKFLCNSLYSWNVYLITQLFSSWYSLCGDIKLCMKYSWDYFDAYKWKVMIMHGRMQFDKLIPLWFEIFIIWNDACNTYAFYYDNICDVLHMMWIMNALNDKCLDIMIDDFVLCIRFLKLCIMNLVIYRLSIFFLP